ncbi:hypothetical protein M2459_001873 [Parabacteroides sp. PF5-5]|uniref:hypothetical protein n=1 Tax=unclassified Parabacteroides TaxID=2649774 RepID=UPI00247381D2|nr:MULTISPECIES: hypothetical protein [unclassified Parabacteroides]MDH6305420.1 hypothetical protein [Parabacteroides sp. PH5-39]MDH6316130.1 hypothetical protein [Parabacteroides sp. PF5-13]MDH6320280.1 hypothetical protein [Parabacteroides sp. PH5-13]MDH6324010.1 hypothetical protein [Parabacteroides sp. PH5-8]MDH6327321.1 hypothetical protein [Parabacteroides sp. PH5-41]
MKNNAIDMLLIERILEYIPYNIKPVDYLMDILSLNRNSVYRRLRYEKSFSFHEIMKLSSAMGFSLDDIASAVNSDFRSGLHNNQANKITAESSTVSLFAHFKALLSNFIPTNDSLFIITSNRLQFLFIKEEVPLFRFLYYQLMYQLREIPVNHPFSQTTIPETVRASSREFNTLFMSKNGKEYIIDPNICLNIVRDIQYFYQRKLITEKELLHLKESLHATIKYTQTYMQAGFNDSPFKKSKFYLSGMEVTSNTIYSVYEGKEESNVWLYSANPIHITNKEICNIHKQWIDSLMRNSTLISGASENILLDFISKQLEFVDNMDKIMY